MTDERGTVREFYRESAFREAGLPSLGPWVQVNLTETRQGTIRGLHGEHLVKLVAVAEGEAFGAYVDTRQGSPSYGKTVTVSLTVSPIIDDAGVVVGAATSSRRFSELQEARDRFEVRMDKLRSEAIGFLGEMRR